MTRDDIIAQVQRNISFGMVPDGYRPDPAQLWPYSLSGGAESYGAESPSRVSPAQARAYGGTAKGGGGFPFPLLGGGGAPGEYPEYEEYEQEAWNSAENAGEASAENSTSLSDLVAKARELYNKTVSRSAESDRKFEPEITAKGKDLGENRAKPQETGGTGSPEARETEARKLGELVDHAQLKGMDSRLVDQIRARERIDITQEYPEAQKLTYSDQVDTVSGADEKYRERLDITQEYPEATRLVESNQLDAITGADRSTREIMDAVSGADKTLMDSTNGIYRQSGAGRSFELRPGATEQLIDRRNVFQRAFDAMGNYMASENEKNLASPGRFVATEIVPYGLAAPLIGGAASLGAGAIASAPLTAPVLREASNVIDFAQAAQKLAPVTAPAAASSASNVVNIADYLGKGISAAASVVGGALVGARQSAGWDSSKMKYTAPQKTTEDPMKSVANKMLKSLGG